MLCSFENKHLHVKKNILAENKNLIIKNGKKPWRAPHLQKKNTNKMTEVMSSMTSLLSLKQPIFFMRSYALILYFIIIFFYDFYDIKNI
jgi:hypothetical protein